MGCRILKYLAEIAFHKKSFRDHCTKFPYYCTTELIEDVGLESEGCKETGRNLLNITLSLVDKYSTRTPPS